ncbi:Spermidine/putrescine-binding periplasmic protein 1 [Sesamum angolense]|uniref:Spermidine/putrescine-binding periplasmic protein 1 n=1 Tax=Sesamum angolense TaxID=2727404 RepID=A0AAE1WWQ9_9LAMI|nr:Spermidine/putrescine-binding periplasmic protein 1 [Sesamum angolense]
MPVLSLPSIPGPICSNPNPTLTWIRTPRYPPRRLSIKLTATLNNSPCSSAGDFLRQLSVSSVVLIGLGLSSLWAFPPPASARICPASPSSLAHAQETLGEFENLENIEDEDMKVAFERWKSKTYALTVPLRIVALEGSVPPVWVRVYLRRSSEGNLDSQGRIWAVPYRWGSMVIAYNRKEFQKHKLAPVQVIVALSLYLSGVLTLVCAYRICSADQHFCFSNVTAIFVQNPLPYLNLVLKAKVEILIQDWSDLWRPELAGKISMVDSPREIVGAVLKCMGASYNTANVDSQVVGGKYAVLHQLELLVQQSSNELYTGSTIDSQHYLKAFRAGDVWVAVGWSSDVLPVAKTMSNVSVIVPKSGASLWADFWAVPSVSRLVTDQIGGRVRGPSPLVEQWVEFCLQPERALPFKEEIIAGASPISLKSMVEGPQKRRNGGPKLDTNLIANIPPAEILSRCELLEPLSEDTLSDYQWLIQSLQKPHHSIMNRLTRSISSTFPAFWSKLQSRAA